MKKCPECGNPSYDGAPVCGNCGYKFPKPKPEVSQKENIFQESKKVHGSNNEDDVITILKENKIVIGIILIITIIAIAGIVLTGTGNNNSNETSNITNFSEAGFSFNYPNSWEKMNSTDSDHKDSVFFKNGNNTTIQYYNVTSSSTSLKEITQQRISNAQYNGDSVDTVQTITLDKRNASNIILENNDGDYTRYVSILSGSTLYVYKINGSSLNDVNAPDINSMIDSTKIS